jgi:hypothetical protein
MSETEVHKGKLVPMVLSGVTLEERANDACAKLEFVKREWHKSWLDCLQDEGYRKVIIRDKVIYKVHDEELDPFGFTSITQNEDGSIDYIIMYYNGGGSFDEVLDYAIDRAEKDD